MECVGYTYACKELLPISHVTYYYGELQHRFLICHFVFITIVLSHYYPSPKEQKIINEDEMASPAELHKKQRMLLFVLCGLIRAKSRELLKHWAQSEPLVFFFKGFTQPSRKSIYGGSTITFPIWWKNQDKLYEKCILSFNEILQNRWQSQCCFVEEGSNIWEVYNNPYWHCILGPTGQANFSSKWHSS